MLENYCVKLYFPIVIIGLNEDFCTRIFGVVTNNVINFFHNLSFSWLIRQKPHH